MYPIGHFALGYFSSEIVGKITKEKVNYPIVYIVSIIPDIDLFISSIEHRGPTHSIVVAILIFLPIIIVYKHGFSYFASLASHSLIGDFFTFNGCRLFWPIVPFWYRAPRPYRIEERSLILVEASLFVLMIKSIMWKKLRMR
jgi:membrane-bound metal-dependent hydrolase YbcI (DUF457 family)